MARDRIKFKFWFFFDNHHPVRYHSEFEYIGGLIRFIERKFGSWKYFNAYWPNEDFEGRHYPQEFFGSAKYDKNYNNGFDVYL